MRLEYSEIYLSKKAYTVLSRAFNTDFGMGEDQSPPIGGGPKGGDKAPMGGDWRVIRDKIKGTKKMRVNL